MHVSEAVLSGTSSGQIVLGAGMVLAAAGTALGLRKLDYERIPQVAVLSSAFFVASLIHVPGPVAVHLVLNGLMGLVLGWAAFPAILIALLLQALFFQFGGLTAVGVNTLMMALPAVACYYLLNRAVRSGSKVVALLAGLAAGAAGVFLGALLAAAALSLAGQPLIMLGKVFLWAHLPVAAIDGLVTASAVMFLRKVRPELLAAPLMAPARPGSPHA
jgi:cobalt/nickel transport system permease protein